MAKKAIIALNEGSMTSGVVENLIEITDSASIGFKLPDNRLMWDCGQYPVAIGDEWNDGVFTRNGEAITAVPTIESRVSNLEETTDTIILEMLADHEYRISLSELGLTEADI